MRRRLLRFRRRADSWLVIVPIVLIFIIVALLIGIEICTRTRPMSLVYKA